MQRKPQRWQSLGFLLRYSKYLFHLFAYRHYIICNSGMQYSQIEKIMIYFISCRTQSGNRKGVNRLDLITSFLVSVMAGVVSYYICKWLDRNDSDNQPKESPRGCDSGAFALCTTWIQLLSQLSPLYHMQIQNAIFQNQNFTTSGKEKSTAAAWIGKKESFILHKSLKIQEITSTNLPIFVI